MIRRLGRHATAARLPTLLAQYDLGAWITTIDVLVDETAIPHSHPVLTRHTRQLSDDDRLLTTFLHEQLHWWAMEHGDLGGARRAFRERWPDVPNSGNGGAAGDKRSTWLHLAVRDRGGGSEGKATATSTVAATSVRIGMDLMWIGSLVACGPGRRDPTPSVVRGTSSQASAAVREHAPG